MRKVLLLLLLLIAAFCSASGEETCSVQPESRCSSCPLYIEGGGPVSLFNGTGLELGDDDTNEAFPSLQSASVELLTDTDDAASVVLIVNRTMCEEYNVTCSNGTSVDGRPALSITGNHTIDTYQELLMQVQFNITTDEPVLVDRIVSLEVCDGTFCSGPARLLVQVEGINDNDPMIDIVPAGMPFVEGDVDGVLVAQSVNITDVDNDSVFMFMEARVTILNVRDEGYENLTVNVSSAGDLIDVNYLYNDITLELTLELNGSANGLTYSGVLETIRYSNTANEPITTPRMIEFVIDDGINQNSTNVTISVVADNDNPTMINVGQLPNFDEQQPGPLYLLNEINITDTDSANSDVYIQLFTASLIGGSINESLSFNDSSGLASSMGRRATLSGNATLEDYMDAIASLVYINSGNELTCPLFRDVNLTIQDEIHTTSVVVTFCLIPMPDNEPMISPTYSSTVFTEGSRRTGPIFPAIVISDEDEECTNNTLQYAIVSIDTFTTEDEFIIPINCDENIDFSGSGSGRGNINGFPIYTTSDFTGKNGSVIEQQSVNLECQNSRTEVCPEIDMLQPPNDTVVVISCLYNNNPSLIIAGEAPNFVYELLIQDIIYYNNENEPGISNRTVSLLVADGDFNTTAYSTITIEPVADSDPVINPEGSPNMTENMGPISVVYNITDVDQFNDHQLIDQVTITLNNPLVNEDSLLYNGSPLNDTFTYTVNCSDCEYLTCCVERVQNITYNNTEDEPSYPFWRNFTIVVQPQQSALQDPSSVTTIESNVLLQIILVNDYPPVIQVNGLAPANEVFVVEFYEEGDPVAIFYNPNITDNDAGPNLITSVTIEVINGNASDQFEYVNNNTDLIVTSIGGLLEINGSATIEEYLIVLSTVQYFNTLDEPNIAYPERNITVTIREDLQYSDSYITVQLVPVNDPAQYNFPNRTIIFNESTRNPVLLFDPSYVIEDSDPDGGTLTYATLSLWPIVHENDTIMITDNGGLSVDGNQTYINVSGVADFSTYERVLRTATFVNMFLDPDPSIQRQLIVNTFDGRNNSDGPTIFINISAFDDPPYCFYNGNLNMQSPAAPRRFDECDGEEVFCGERLCSGESCFNITDLDSNDTFPAEAIAIVTIQDAVDAFDTGTNKSEQIVFTNNSYGVNIREVPSPQFTVQYEISNISTYTQLVEVLQSAVYNNSQSPPSTVMRTVNISINISGSQSCLIGIDVRTASGLRAVLPNRLEADPVLNYTEDSGLMSLIPEDVQDEFSFANRGVDTGYSVRLSIVRGSNDDPGRLVITESLETLPDSIGVSGNNTSTIFVQSTAAFENAPVADFTNVFRTVQISFADQAPMRCTREPPYDGCAVVQFETQDFFFGNIEGGVDHITTLYVAVEGVNDRPQLSGLRNAFTVLDDYLPPEINIGFNASFLITESEVMDDDRTSHTAEFIGLAIIATSEGSNGSLGIWQHTTDPFGGWDNITNINACYPLFVYPEDYIRFYPFVNPERVSGNVSLTTQAWDGSSIDTTCTGEVDSNTLPVSENNETFVYRLVYLNRAPVVFNRNFSISTNEDTVSENVSVSSIVMGSAFDPEGSDLGLAVINMDTGVGYWQYWSESMESWTNIPYNSTRENAFLLYPNNTIRFYPAGNASGVSFIEVLAAEVDNGSRIVNTTASNPFKSNYSVYSINITIMVVSVLDAPVLFCPNLMVTYMENAIPVNVFDGLIIASIETDYLMSATVELVAEDSVDINDMLHYINNEDFIIIRNGSHQFTVTSSRNNSISAFQDFLRLITFSIDNDTQIEPSLQMRSVVLTVTDQKGTSSSKSVDVDVLLVNDQSLNISIPVDMLTFVEESGPLQIFPDGVVIVDPDDNVDMRSEIISATLILYGHSDQYEWLSFNTTANSNITGIFRNGILQLMGSGTVNNYQEAFTGVWYHNNASEPDANSLQRMVYVSVHDGTFYSNNASLTINILSVNDQPPVLQLGSGRVNNTITFTEGSDPVYLAVDAIITDNDSDSSTSMSYSLEIEIIGVQYDEGVFRMHTQNASELFQTDGPMRRQDVQDVLRELQYINRAMQPTGSYRLIRVTVFDAGQEANPFEDTAYVLVMFNLVDDLPQFMFNTPAIMYAEGDGVVQVAPTLTVNDVDDAELSSATIELTAVNATLNFTVEVLAIDEGLLNGTNIFISDSDPGQLILTGRDSLETYEQVLRSLTYEHRISMGQTMSGQRTLVGSVEGTRVNTTSEVDTLTIFFSSVNNPPLIDLNGPGRIGQDLSTTFVEEGDPVAIASDEAFVMDVDNANLQYINITLTNPLDGRDESILLGNISDHHIMFNMDVPLSTYSEVIRNITYVNYANEPNPEPRVVEFVATDGYIYSDIVQTTIYISLTDDLPELFLNSDESSVNYSTTFIENGRPVELTLNPIVNDSDAVNVTKLEIMLTPALGLINASVPLLMVGDSLCFNETVMLDEVIDILSSLTYEDRADEPLSGNRQVCISVTIDGARSNVACTEVMLEPVNDSPLMFTMRNYNASIIENQATVNVVQVSATDNDSVNSLVNITYTLISVEGVPFDQTCPGDPSSGDGMISGDPYPFAIDLISGLITTTDSPPDREAFSQYSLLVEASNGNETDMAYVFIDVQDEDDNCATFYPKMYYAIVPPCAVAGTPLVNLSACDLDENRIDTSISDVRVANQTMGFTIPLFGLTGLTLELLVDESTLIGFNSRTFYVDVKITSIVIASGVCPLDEIATVRVVLNSCSLEFSQHAYTVVVPENTSLSIPFLQVFAAHNDDACNGVITYNISDGRMFDIDDNSGNISLVQQLDCESAEQHTFNITATDQCFFTTASIVVDVMDVNEHDPVFNQSSYTASLHEHSDMGSVVVIVFAEDNDCTSNFTYEFSNPDGVIATDLYNSDIVVSSLFSIDQYTGVITLVNSTLFDSELLSTVNFTVIARDVIMSSSFGEADVFVNAVNLNDSNPVFNMSLYMVNNVTENFTPNTLNCSTIIPEHCAIVLPVNASTTERFILQVEAFDPDDPNNTSPLTYSSNFNPAYFSINESTGVITSLVALDREIQRSFSFQVMATDASGSSGSAVVEITIGDANDNQPTFIPETYSTTIREDISVNESILQVTISDLDEVDTINSKLEVSIFNSTSTDVPFNISAPTRMSLYHYVAAIFLASPLDCEQTSEYTLVVQASDSGVPSLTGAALVNIQVTGVNVNRPKITLERNSVIFYDGSRTVDLAPGISIADNDTEMLRSATVTINGISPFDPQSSFTPNDNSLPYECPLENKLRKFQACGFSDPVLVTNPSDVRLFSGAVLDESNTLHLNADDRQYLFYQPNLEISSGASILLWVRKQPGSASEQTIFSKGNIISRENFLFIRCLLDNSLQFGFLNSTRDQNTIVYDSICGKLEGAWHHIGFVLRLYNNRWVVDFYYDGALNRTQYIDAPYDEEHPLFLGTDAGRQYFFNGSIHFAVVSTMPANVNNDVNCAIGCGVSLHSPIETASLQYHYSYDHSTFSVSGIAPLSTYVELLESLFFISTFSATFSGSYLLQFQVTDTLRCEPFTSNNSTVVDYVIGVVCFNGEPPVLLLDGNISPNYATEFTEGEPAVSIVNVDSVSLTDGEINPSNYTLAIRIMNPQQGDEERLMFTEGSTFPSLQINDSIPHTLIISGYVNIMAVEDALKRVVYINTAEELVGTNRIVEFTVEDVCFNQPQMSDPATTHITLVPVNDPPEILVQPEFVNYLEGNDSVSLVESVAISDNDGMILTRARISLTALDGNEEAIEVVVNNTNITAMYSNNTIELIGNTTHDEYVQVLSTLSYSHSSQQPSRGMRTVSIRVFDGYIYSEEETVLIFFNSVNDPPVLDPNGPEPGLKYTVEFIEDTTEAIRLLSPNFTLIDVDNSSLASITVLLSDNPDDDVDFRTEYIWYNPRPGSEFISSPTQNSLRLIPFNISGESSIEEFMRVIATAEYVNTAEEPTPGTRNITFIVSDGIDTSTSYTCVQVIARNDRPVLDLNGNETDGVNFTATFIDSGGLIPITSQNVIVTDNDENSIITFFAIEMQNPLDEAMEMILFNPNDSLTCDYTTTTNVRCNTTGFTTCEVIDILNGVMYDNAENEPSVGVRQVDFLVNDGEEYSNIASAFINIQLQNEHDPMFTMDNYTVNISENSSIGTSLGIPNFIATDQDKGIDGVISYSIVSGNDLGHFSINASTGTIYINAVLDRENISDYRLVVEARDGGTPQRMDTALVQITVTNVNEHAPQFVPDTRYNLTVLESAAINDVIYSIVASDEDGDVVMFSYDGGEGAIGLTMDGRIIVLASLDAETILEYTINVTIADNGGLITTATFTIAVGDVNEHCPQFSSDMYTMSVSEGIPVGVPFADIAATDEDVTSMLIYNLSDLSTFEYVNGQLQAVVELDREMLDQYFLTLSVTDGLCSANLSITINITDVNDNPPLFDAPSYDILVLENVGNLSLVRLNATDADLGNNSEITYFIPNPVDGIRIDSITSEITLVDPLDFETTPSLVFRVYAMDNGIPPLNSSAIINITVDDLFEEPPTFERPEYAVMVPEGMANISVETVMVTDDGNVEFSLLEEFDTFAIDPMTGEITTIVALDYENVCLYRLTITATNLDYQEAVLQSNATVEVYVQNVHDEAPTFNQSMYTVSVCENQEPGTSVVMIYATDADSSPELCFVSLLEGSGSGLDILDSELRYSLYNYTDIFMIDSITGQITTRVPLDREERTRYSIPVIVTDAVNSTDRTIVNVLVEDKNDNLPSFINDSYSFNIPENTAVGSVVFQLMAEDQDMLDNGNLWYVLPDEVTDFAISQNNGTLFLSQSLDYDNGPMQYSFIAIVYDTAGQNDTAVVTIVITDLNDNVPVLSNITTNVTFMEGQVSHQTLSDIVIFDADSFQTLDSASVTLMLNDALDALPENCRCSDSQNSSTCGPPDCLEFLQLGYAFPGTVTLSHVNNNITLYLSGTYSIGTYMSALRNIEYINIITNPIAESRLLHVYVNDGDFDSKTLTQTITIQPVNEFPPVLDLNGVDITGRNFSTDFTESGISVQIVSPDVAITDEDSDRSMDVLTRVEIEILNPLDGNSEQLFSLYTPPEVTLTGNMSHSLIITGQQSFDEYLQVLRGLRYVNSMDEPILVSRQVIFTVHQFQLVGTTVYATVNIIGENNHPPVVYVGGGNLQNFETEFSEGGTGVPIVDPSVRITDEDSGTDIITSLTVQSIFASFTPSDDLFLSNTSQLPDGITYTDNNDTGRLTLSGPAPIGDYTFAIQLIRYRSLDDEFMEGDRLSRLVGVTATDSSLTSASSFVDVTLIPVNDNQPRFTVDQHHLQFAEDTPMGTVLLVLSAVDNDTNILPSTLYTIASSEPEQIAYINNVTGELVLNNQLDREGPYPIILSTVYATDTMYVGPLTPGLANVSITVLDKNDNDPYFPQQLYNASVEENVPIGTSIITMVARDDDVDANNSQIVYKIIGSTEFVISLNGVVTTNALLDKERQCVYELTVIARHPIDPSNGTTILNITVLDVDEDAPVAVLNPNSGILEEPNTITNLSNMLIIADNDTTDVLSFATVRIQPNGNTPVPGQLLSTRSHPLVSVTGNNSQMLQFSGTASFEDYQQILRHIVYQDNAAEPIPGTRTISFTVGYQNMTTKSLFSLTVVVINDNPPFLTLDSSDTLPSPGDNDMIDAMELGSADVVIGSFVEEGPAVPVASEFLTITDTDSGINNMSYAIVWIEDSRDARERLLVNFTANIQLASGSNSTWLNLTGPASIKEFEDILKGISYINTDEPTGDFRTISFYVNDGLFNSNMPSSFITLVRVNDPPTVTLGLNGTIDVMLNYTEGQTSPLMISQNIQITDPEDDPIGLVSVIISDRFDEEELSISTPPSLRDINQENGLSLFAIPAARASVFENALRTLGYDTSLSEIRSEYLPRIITIIATDESGANSEPAVVRINFLSVDNNPPMVDLNGPLVSGLNHSTTFNEGSTTGIPIASPDATIRDIDSNQLSFLTISFENVPDSSEDLLINSTGFMVERFRDNNGLYINVTGERDISDYLAALLSVRYINTADEPIPATRVISVQAFSSDSIGNMLGSEIVYSSVSVQPVNDNDPVFRADTYNGSVLENVDVGTPVGVTVSATDNDIYGDTNITYRVAQDVINFAVDRVTGVITTAVSTLDREADDLITFTVLAIDNDSNMRTGMATVNVRVLDQNDNTPVITLDDTTLNIPENISINSVILVVTATDDDIGSNSEISYQLTESADGVDLTGNGFEGVSFGIAEQNGNVVVTVIRHLDIETVPAYNLTIEAVDGGSPSLTGTVVVEVMLSDINDNAPRFLNLPTNISVSENTPVGMEVFQVRATDSDVTPGFNQLTFSLSTSSTFIIDRISGVLSLNDILDFEQTQSYILTVLVSDSSFTTVDTLVVRVSNVNEPPQFDRDLYNVTINENTFVRITLNATDPENNTLAYSFVEDNDIFNISPLMGIVSSVNVVDYETTPFIQMVVQVSEIGGNPLSFDTANISITVLDLNDNPPVFTEAVYSVNLRENAPINQSIVSVSAIDEDSSSNGVITYAIASSDEFFRIDSQSGTIFLRSSLDHEVNTTHTLTVTATDMGTPALTGTTTVMIYVNDTNDNPPMLSTDETLVTYVENSGSVLFARSIVVRDADSSAHPLVGASVTLHTGECRLSATELQEVCQSQSNSCVTYCAERLAFNRDLLATYGLVEQPISNDHMIFIAGNASETSYQQLLRSFAYINFASEPYAGDRVVSLQVTDEQSSAGESNVVNVTIRVELRDEFCPVISSEVNTVDYAEGSNVSYIGNDVAFSITDEDREPHKMLDMVTITLRSVQEGESISLEGSRSLLITSRINGSDQIITIQGAATIEVYRQILQNLTYTNTQDEPILGQRIIQISPSVGSLQCTAHTIVVNVLPVNDNPPVLAVSTSTIMYTEESGALLFAEAAGLVLSDHDHSEVSNIEFAEVTLTNVEDGNMETLGLNISPPAGTSLIEDGHRLVINGTHSIPVYNSLLSNLTYTNVATEPTQGIRMVQITVFDGVHSSNRPTIAIAIMLLNDNDVRIMIGNSSLLFIDGMPELRVGQDAMVALMDRDGEISSVEISLSDQLDESERIRISNDSSANVYTNGSYIFVNGTMSVSMYQVLLNSLTYSYSSLMESIAGNRTITISVSDGTSVATDSITIQVIIPNIHPPLVDLNGPNLDGIDYFTSVQFNYVTPNIVEIASPNVSVFDLDTNAFINRLEVSLDGMDFLILDLPNCALPQDLDEISCHIMIGQQLTCMCSESLQPSQDPMVLNVGLTQRTLNVVQQENPMSFTIFENLLANVIKFQHRSASDSNYTSTISTRVSDGERYSQIARTFVDVIHQPSPDTVLSVPEIIIVEDGSPSTLVAMSASIDNNDQMLEGLTVTLNGIVHAGEENLTVDETIATQLGIQVLVSSEDRLRFSGVATVQNYTRVLTSIYYNYDRMQSIIDNSPDFSNRTVSIEAIDTAGRLSSPAQVVVTIDNVCRQTRDGSTVTVSSVAELEQISLCRGLELNLVIRFADNIDSLRPLSNLLFVEKLSINSLRSLTTLEGLENLRSYSSLEIINNRQLSTLEHLGSNYPSSIGLTVEDVYVSSNEQLEDITGLYHISNITGDFYLFSDGMLSDLSGTNNLLQIHNLIFYLLPQITDLNAFEQLWKAYSIRIQNMGLQAITGFQRLREVRMLQISGSTGLVHIDGFGGILSALSVTINRTPSLCYILDQTPNEAYWARLGAQSIDVTVGDNCRRRTCSDDPCYNGGQCDMVADTAYSCMCTGTGYYNGNDLQGCLFLNNCQTEPCLNGGTCSLNELRLLGYRCDCPAGFTGTTCDSTL